MLVEEAAAVPLPEPMQALRAAEADVARVGNSVRRQLLSVAPGLQQQQQQQQQPASGGGGGGWEAAVQRGAEQWSAQDVAALLALVLVGEEEGGDKDEAEGGQHGKDKRASANDHVGPGIEEAEERTELDEALPSPATYSTGDNVRRQLSAVATSSLSERVARAVLAQGLDGAAVERVVRCQDRAAVRKLLQSDDNASACADDGDDAEWLLARMTAKWQQLRQLRKVQRALPPHKFIPKLHEFLGCARNF